MPAFSGMTISGRPPCFANLWTTTLGEIFEFGIEPMFLWVTNRFNDLAAAVVW
jgi:hypothetical protein